MVKSIIEIMFSSYYIDKVINFNKGDSMSEKIEIFNLDTKGNKINPKNLILKDKIIYEIIKKYIKI